MPDVRIVFSKEGTARYISHLDLMRTMQRAFVRAGITIRHTEGFHPHPYVSIPLPLPLGFSSQCEILEFGLVAGADMDTLPAQMNAALPTGIVVHRCYAGGLPFRRLTFVRYEMTLEWDRAVASEAADALQELIRRESYLLTKKSKKAKSGQTQVDIIPLIQTLETRTLQEDVLQVQTILRAQNPGLNPALLLEAFRLAYPALSPIYVSYRRMAVLDDQLEPYQ